MSKNIGHPQDQYKTATCGSDLQINLLFACSVEATTAVTLQKRRKIWCSKPASVEFETIHKSQETSGPLTRMRWIHAQMLPAKTRKKPVGNGAVRYNPIRIMRYATTSFSLRLIGVTAFLQTMRTQLTKNIIIACSIAFM